MTKAIFSTFNIIQNYRENVNNPKEHSKLKTLLSSGLITLDSIFVISCVSFGIIAILASSGIGLGPLNFLALSSVPLEVSITILAVGVVIGGADFLMIILEFSLQRPKNTTNHQSASLSSPTIPISYTTPTNTRPAPCFTGASRPTQPPSFSTKRKPTQQEFYFTRTPQPTQPTSLSAERKPTQQEFYFTRVPQPTQTTSLPAQPTTQFTYGVPLSPITPTTPTVTWQELVDESRAFEDQTKKEYLKKVNELLEKAIQQVNDCENITISTMRDLILDSSIKTLINIARDYLDFFKNFESCQSTFIFAIKASNKIIDDETKVNAKANIIKSLKGCEANPLFQSYFKEIMDEFRVS